MRPTAFGPTNAPLPPKRGRPILLEAGAWRLDSADKPDQVSSLRRWMQDPLFAAPLGRRAGDPGEQVVANFIARFDRLSSHLFTIRQADDAPVGMAMVHIDVPNRLCWIDLTIGDRQGVDSQTTLTAAAYALGVWIFETLELDKINVQVTEANERTASWVERRMTLEARLRDEILLPSGKRATVLRYGLLRSEWEAIKLWRENRHATGGNPEEPRRSFRTRPPRLD